MFLRYFCVHNCVTKKYEQRKKCLQKTIKTYLNATFTEVHNVGEFELVVGLLVDREAAREGVRTVRRNLDFPVNQVTCEIHA